MLGDGAPGEVGERDARTAVVARPPMGAVESPADRSPIRPPRPPVDQAPTQALALSADQRITRPMKLWTSAAPHASTPAESPAARRVEGSEPAAPQPRNGLVWPSLLAAITVLVLAAPPWLALPAALGALLVALLRLTHARIFLTLVLAMVPYAIGSYLGALLGITYYPWASAAQYWHANSIQLAAIVLLAAIGLATPLAAGFDRAVHSSIDMVRTTRRLRPGAMYVAWAVTALIAANDYRVLIANYAAIRAANRHNFDSEFIVAGGGFGILIALSLTCIFAFAIAIARRHVAVNAVMLALLWGPKLLAGNRLYTLQGIAICALLFLLLARSRRLKRLVVAGLGLGAVAYFFLPTLWVDNPMIGLNEWIMPNTLYVSLQTGAVTLESLGASPFFARWVMLLPPGVRPYEPSSYPELFSASYSSVGVGANPFADVFTGNTAGTMAAFVAATALIMAVGVWLTRISPIAIFVTFATMLTWGRSPFWETLTVIVDVALVTWPCFRLPPRHSVAPRSGSGRRRTLPPRRSSASQKSAARTIR